MRLRLASALLLLCLLGGCATERETVPTERPAEPPDFPAAFYLEANARGEPVYRVDSNRSQILMRVYRGGSLARFGHDHVIAARDVRGYALWANDLRAARGDLYAAIDTFTLDEPALRARAGFATQPTQSDIEGTRRNMRKALEADAYPFVTAHLAATGQDGRYVTLHADVTLHGVTRRLSIAAELDTSNPASRYITGRFSVNQADFGITPFSLLGGALQVQDRVDIEFELTLAPLPR